MKKETFERLSPAKKRLAIARDIIAQIKCNKYIGEAGQYITLLDEDEMVIHSDEGVKENFERINQCKVCEVGAIMLSAIRIRNNFNFSEVDGCAEGFDTKKVKKLLRCTFSPAQLFIMECAFEGGRNGDRLADWAFDYWGELTVFEENAILKLKQKYPNDTDRLAAIMRNIIRNKGTFKL